MKDGEIHLGNPSERASRNQTSTGGSALSVIESEEVERQHLDIMGSRRVSKLTCSTFDLVYIHISNLAAYTSWPNA